VDCEPRDPTSAVVRVRVEDSGIGIPPDKLGVVFDKFTQVDASATRRFGGTGLGLSISQQLVGLLGGEIGADSLEGQGSTFWFSLPLELDLEAGEPEPLPSAELHDARVLIVDDLEVNRRLLEERLSNRGIRHGSCKGGREALAALQAEAASGDPYDIAILDYQMPDMDGERLGREIKADPAIRDTVLVMLTSVGRQGDALRLREAGFAAYLIKPSLDQQLHRTLATVWGAYRQNKSIGLVTRHTLAEAAEPDNQQAGERKRARALVAEDNVVNQRVAVRILERLGCEVDLAVNGRQALEMVQQGSYDMIFMDCQMPELDGYEATREIRGQQAPTCEVPIIAMTANAMKGDREKCLEAGMDDYISKPVNREAFEAALERWSSGVRERRHLSPDP
jgi:CheY-like chemotaxis protein